MAALAVLVTATTLSRTTCPDYWDIATPKMLALEKEKMSGTWYEIKSRPITGLTDECTCISDTLVPRADGTTWSEEYRATCNGYPLLINGTLVPTPEFGDWSLTLSTTMDWWILDHEEDYEYALLYACGFFTVGDQLSVPIEYPYFYSRKPEDLPAALETKWTKYLEDHDVDVDSMKAWNMTGCFDE